MVKDIDSSNQNTNEEEKINEEARTIYGLNRNNDTIEQLGNEYDTIGASTIPNDNIQSTGEYFEQDSHHNYHEDEENRNRQMHPSYNFQPIENHESDCNNHIHHEPNDLNLSANASAVASVAVGHENGFPAVAAIQNNDDHCHNYFKDDETHYNNRSPQQSSNYHNLHVDIPSGKLTKPVMDKISPSSSLMADDDTDVTPDDHVINRLHNPSLELHPDETETKESSLDEFIMNENQHIVSSPHSSTIPTTLPPPPPPPSEQTAREQLIERERQGRLERDRARLKQQLALSRERYEEDEAYADIDRVRERIASIDNNSLDVMDLTDVEEGDDDDDDEDNVMTDNQSSGSILSNQPGHLTGSAISDSNTDTSIPDGNIMNDEVILGAIRGNVGATQVSSTAPSPLGFTMERFLQDGVMAQPPTNDNMTSGANNGNVESNVSDDPEHGHDEINDHSLDDDSNTNHQLVDLISEASNTSEIANVSIIAEPLLEGESTDSIRHTIGIRSARLDREYNFNDNPRLARLTEAEILELAEIDYASVGNMPPRSERDEQHLPSIHDLSGLGRISNMSDQTYATMLESISMASADVSQSEANSAIIRAVDESRPSPVINSDIDDEEVFINASSFKAASVKPVEQISLSITNSGDGNNSESALRIPQELTLNDNVEGEPKSPDDNCKPPALDNENLSNHSFRVNLEDGAVEIIDEQNTSDDTYNLPNRVIRPGITNTSNNSKPLKDPIHRRSQTTPIIPSFVDDFDYNKYNESPEQNDVCKGFPGLIDNSQTPLHPHQSHFDCYGSTSLHNNNNNDLDNHSQMNSVLDEEELQSLFPKKRHRRESIDEMMDSVFSSVRSLSTDDIEADINDCDKYLRSTVLERGKLISREYIFCCIVIETHLF
jgi:hypothetical protein